MNEHFDPLEAELAALQPREPSPDLKLRIAERLAADDARPQPVMSRSLAKRLAIQVTYAAGLAASLVLAGLLWRSQRPTVAQRPDEPAPPMAAAFDDSLPSVWTYQRALVHSPDALEAKLDKHAAVWGFESRQTRSQILIRSETEMLSNGEL